MVVSLGDLSRSSHDVQGTGEQPPRAFPFYSLYDSPGMPAPGPDFEKAADNLVIESTAASSNDAAAVLRSKQSWMTWLYTRALYDRNFELEVTAKGCGRQARFVLGHLWGRPFGEEDGPRASDVMIVGKHPGLDEVQAGRNFVGPISEPLIRVVQELDIPDVIYGSWYLANLVRHGPLNPGSSSLAAGWIKNCLPLLHQELRIVRPNYLLLLGSEAAKAVLGKSTTISRMYGRVTDYELPIYENGEEPQTHHIKVMACMHPAAVYHEPANYDQFRDSFELFWQLVNGAIIDAAEPDIDHRVIYKERVLAREVDELIAAGCNSFAIDAEWHGDYPTEDNAYLRTIQVSAGPKHAFAVALRKPGGEPCFKPGLLAALPHLKRLLKSTPDRPVRVGGHFFRSDLPWLYEYGLDLRDEYACPGHRDGVPGWERMRQGVGGFDTALQLHAVFETGPFQLEHNASRLCRVPRYDVPLHQWKTQYCKANGIEVADLEGYGECPDSILHPYSMYDSDATARLDARATGTGDDSGLLTCDMHGLNSWRACWQSHRASLAFLEMEMTGVLIDRERGEELTAAYAESRANRLRELQEMVNWPGFNPNSVPQCRELLFGQELNGTVDKKTGEPKRLRPDGVESLGLQPIKASGKVAKPWERVVAMRQTRLFSPSTDRETLGILGHRNDKVGEIVRKLRDIRFLSQILRSVLRPPQRDDKGVCLRDTQGQRVYEKGLLSFIQKDGRVRSHFFQTKETGRASSSRPPLMNLGKRREADYKRIQGADYKYPLRSLICAKPGCVLIEADIKAAEMGALAWASNDPQLIADVARTMLPETHPDYIDLHAQTAVRAFRLSCEPTKAGLASINMKHIRVAAKNVNFGIPYGRGAEAIARQCREEGVAVTIKEAEKLRSAYFDRYTRVYDFLEECKERVVNPGWMCGAFGRYRRFAPTDDEKVLGAQQRQACNFPIQNLVADAVSEALYHFYNYRSTCDVVYRLVLQIHDAVLLEVPLPYVEKVVKEVIPACMCERVTITPRSLDGALLPVPARHFGVDIELFVNWGIPLTSATARELGIPGDIVA